MKSPNDDHADNFVELSCANATLPPEPVVLGTVGSVLDEAHSRIAAGTLLPWGSVLAHAQTAGRGQLRRHWHSPEGNIYAALRLPHAHPFVGSEAAPALGALLTTAMRELCRAEGGTHEGAVGVYLKWPNDVVCLFQGTARKVGGILLEERNGCLVAGMGINVCHAPARELLRAEHAMPAGCLADLPIPLLEQEKISQTAPAVMAERVWLRLVRALHFWYTKEFLTTTRWLTLAEECLLWKNHTVFLQDGHGEPSEVSGTLLGLAPSGGVRLAVEGREQVYLSGSLTA